MDADVVRVLVVGLQNFLNLYTVILLIRVLLTWFQGAGWAQQGISALSPITDPYLNVFRSLIPPLGGLDISPMLAFFALSFLGQFLVQLVGGLLYSLV
ncbi:YggT family protein [Spirulina sp. CCNP1310]|uniref:YggT family protein n=1 Tax=Spirulina sp. CCNP1310 TaxID=3110249 RepID=UPI002B2216C4|nr:YggT family protein [Spirulina sp. CCNP1310]MEA5419728.1 YggT family protein [Spirulina sp. CCNP1310]